MPAPLAVTMGEPAGIGGEILLKAWARRTDRTPVFFAIDSVARLEAIATRFGIPCPVTAIKNVKDAAAVFNRALPVLDRGVDLSAATLGTPTPTTAAAVIAAIDRAVALVKAGDASGFVTNPIQKSVLQSAGFAYPGHTEYLGHLADATRVCKLACCQHDCDYKNRPTPRATNKTSQTHTQIHPRMEVMTQLVQFCFSYFPICHIPLLSQFFQTRWKFSGKH